MRFEARRKLQLTIIGSDTILVYESYGLKSRHQAHERMHQVVLFQRSWWGWNLDYAQSCQLLGPRNNNPHTLVQLEVGWCWHLFREPRINVWSSNKMLQQCASKYVTLIPNHHTGITRFNTYHRFRVNCVIGWNKPLKEHSSPICSEYRGIRWAPNGVWIAAEYMFE